MLVLTIVSFAFSAWGSVALVGVIAGTILLDFGVQGTQILNQSQIYRMGAAERSRLTAAYMTPFFLGGAVGSAVSVLAYRAAGWVAVCIAGAATAGIALVRWLFEVLFEVRARRSARIYPRSVPMMCFFQPVRNPMISMVRMNPFPSARFASSFALRVNSS
jgi:cyanate permease